MQKIKDLARLSTDVEVSRKTVPEFPGEEGRLKVLIEGLELMAVAEIGKRQGQMGC